MSEGWKRAVAAAKETDMKPISELQLATLKVIAREGPRSAYPGLKLNTLYALAKRQLVRVQNEIGSMAFPTNSIKFSISEQGKLELLHRNIKTD